MRTIPRWSGYAFLLALPLLCHCQVTQQLFRASLTSGSSANDTQIIVSGAIPFIPDSRNPGSAYVDSELMKILSVQTTGTFGNVQANTVLTVQRGQGGTAATQHNSGALIYAGYAYQFITTTPSGACSPGSANLLNYNTAAWFSCEASVWVSRPTSTGGGGGSGTVTSITASAPLTGGTITASGSIGCQVASGSQAGCLSAADYASFTGKQNALTLPLSVANGGTGTATPGLVAGTNVTITGSWPNQTVNSSGGGGAVSSVFGRTGAVVAASADYTAAQVTNAASTAAANTFGAFLQSFAASSLIIPKSAAAGPTVAGQIAYDTVSNTYQFGNGASTDAIAYFLGAPPTSGNCVQWGSGAYQLTSTGSPCGAGGGGITQLTTDVLAGPGSGSQVATLAAVGSAGSCGDSTHSCQLTFDTKGRETARANVAISGSGGAATAITSGVLGSLPGTCAAGDVYFATNQPAGQQLYQCTATNTWLQTFLNDSTLTLTAGAFGVDLNQFCRFTNSCTVASFWDYGSAAATAPNKKGLAAAIPATCVVGQTYFETDATAGQNLYGCTATNTWTLQGGGGSVTTHWVLATSSVTQTIPGSLSAANILYDTNDAATTNAALHSTSSNTQNFVADATGFWQGNCEVSTTGSSVSMGVIVFVNGAAIANAGGPSTASGTGGWQVNVPWSFHLTSGDIVKCQAVSSTGFTSAAGAGTQFWMAQIH